MKRSDINKIIEQAQSFFEQYHIVLPPFANWDIDRWKIQAPYATEIIECGLGWDLTDFGRGDFSKEGLFLFTLRNGKLGNSSYPKPYAEKIMIVREKQLTLMHCHRQKTEDIIVRGGGNLVFELHNMSPGGGLDDSPVTVLRDGLRETLPGGSHVRLLPGESLTLPPGLFHSFWGEKGDVLVGEVSSVNDDRTDNIFHGEQRRFPKIEEDEAPFRLLVSDYMRFLRRKSEQ